MGKLFAGVSLVAVSIAAVAALFSPVAAAAGEEGRYIVVFKDSVAHPGNLANAQVDELDGDMHAFYSHALDGYAATLPKDEVAELRADPAVDFVTVDHQVSILAATTPTGIQRSFASTNKSLDIDETDDLRANVDVAVIDTGVDYTHPDLNVTARTNCVTGTCVDNTGTDTYGHGTHVAGTIGAIDNGAGVVGVAPGARIWAVKVFEGGSGPESAMVAGVDWVTAHAKEIEVANMSFGCECAMPALETAVTKSVEAGVVDVVAAGNSYGEVKYISPAKNPNVITVSALADYDGKPGGKASYTCELQGLDDHSAFFTSFGPEVDIAAPGVCIYSTLPGNKYGYLSGTSMAAPHVAGAAALLASFSNPNTKADVEAIRNTLVAAGNYEWTDDTKDGVKEPLLDLSNEALFKLKVFAPQNATLPVASPATPLQAVPESASTGTWYYGPTSYSYQWQRCSAAGAECVNIAGATGASYTPVEADVARTLVVKVTASNSAGSATAASKATGLVKPVGQITEYAVPSKDRPFGITNGPDGNVWFTLGYGTGNELGKITPAGAITEYPITGGCWVASVITGPDGNLWFACSGNGKIGKSTTSGEMTFYTVGGGNIIGLTNGPDGNIWFTSTEGKVGKITPAGAITTYTVGSGTNPIQITAGPDGNLWFTARNTSKVGKVTTSGAITEYALPPYSAPYGITTGPDGNLWIGEGAGRIDKMTTSGALTQYSLPVGANVEGIVSGPDGNLWFTNVGSSKIGRITTTGTATEYAVPAGSFPHLMTVGSDKAIWFTNMYTQKIGTIVP